MDEYFVPDIPNIDKEAKEIVDDHTKKMQTLFREELERQLRVYYPNEMELCDQIIQLKQERSRLLSAVEVLRTEIKRSYGCKWKRDVFKILKKALAKADELLKEVE